MYYMYNMQYILFYITERDIRL